ncbi:NHL repeat containing protein [Achlya hypogyna]|uniref:NHL repeat containing protein n=1 Tax=Achlya hypogyna TaxID=1202772 RepID=A0A1V9YQ32_ACHHY|nr:NHL repeat containing protein [Achlya hypogyna]
MAPFKYHVFLSHDWGTDEAGRDNHTRVSIVNDALKAKGIVTWFDGDRMAGNIKKKMADGIEGSALAVIFITQRYMEKVNGSNENDNCQLEFTMISDTQTRARMIPIVMEARMRAQKEWHGAFKLSLATLLYMDFTGDALDEATRDLVDKVQNMLADTNLFPNQADVQIVETAVIAKSAVSAPNTGTGWVAPADTPPRPTATYKTPPFMRHWSKRMWIAISSSLCVAIAIIVIVVVKLSTTTSSSPPTPISTTSISRAYLSLATASITKTVHWDSGTYTLSTVLDNSAAGMPSVLGVASAVTAIVYTTETSLVTWFTNNSATSSIMLAGDSGLGYPLAVAADSSGNVMYVDPVGNTVASRMPDYTSVSTTTSSLYATYTSGVNGPRGVAVCQSTTLGTCNGMAFVANTMANTLMRVSYPPIAQIAFSYTGTLNRPTALAMDQYGATLYVADSGNHCIKSMQINDAYPSLVSFAGTCGTAGYVDGSAMASLFNTPQGIAVDINGNVYVSDTGNHAIRKISAAGQVTTIVGAGSGFYDGSATVAAVNTPLGLAMTNAIPGNAIALYIVDYNNKRLRLLAVPPYLLGPIPISASMVHDRETYVVSTVFEALPGTSVLGVAVGAAPEQYIYASTDSTLLAWPFGNASENVTLAADSGLGTAYTLALDAYGNLIYVDPFANTVTNRSNTIALVQTTDTATYAALAVSVNGSRGVAACPCLDCACTGTTYIADTFNNDITQVSAKGVTTLSLNKDLKWPTALAFDSLGATLYIADTGNHCIRALSLNSTQRLATVAGTCGYSGYIDGSNALFNSPQGLDVDTVGNIFVSDTGNHAVRKVAPTMVTTIVGRGGAFGFADGNQFRAGLHSPVGLAVVSTPDLGSRDIFVVDHGNQRLRQIHLETL